MSSQFISPLISVIIPHLEQGEYLHSCLESLVRQTYDMRRVEIIVVDNGSKTLPKGICSAFDRVRLVEERTPGPGPARNLGVKLTSGDILAFIDADCTADTGWLAAVDAALAQSGVAVVGGDVRIARRDPGHVTMLEAYESIYAYRQEEYIKVQKFSGTGNLAMRRETFDAVGPFCGIERAEDRDWGRRAARLGHAIAYVPDMIVHHPARRSFAELQAKWDRHVSHDFAEYMAMRWGSVRWLGLTLAVAGSPLFETRRIMASKRVATFHERHLAAKAMLRLRLYRCRRMLSAVLGRHSGRSSGAWNRR